VDCQAVVNSSGYGGWPVAMIAEFTDCTIWLFYGFLAGVRGQAILDSEHSLQM